MQAPEGAKTITIQLAASDDSTPRQMGYLAQRSPGPLAEVTTLPPAITEQYSGKEFSAYEFARLPDGTRYLVVLEEDKSLKFLNQNISAMCHARIYRLAPGANSKPEVVREGFESYGGDVTLPVEIQLPGIGATKLKQRRTEIGYNVNSYQDGKLHVYGGRGSPLQVSGSQLTPAGKGQGLGSHNLCLWRPRSVGQSKPVRTPARASYGPNPAAAACRGRGTVGSGNRA